MKAGIWECMGKSESYSGALAGLYKGLWSETLGGVRSLL